MKLKVRFIFFTLLFPSLFTVIFYNLLSFNGSFKHYSIINKKRNLNEEDIYINSRSGSCHKGYFKTFQGNQTKCRKWFNCEEINKYFPLNTDSQVIGNGGTKKVYLVPWEGHSRKFAMSVIGKTSSSDARVQAKQIEGKKIRIKRGITNLVQLQPSKNVIQVFGFCDEEKQVLITEYCGKYQSLGHFAYFKIFLRFSSLDRLRMVIQVIEAFVLLHGGTIKPRVFCDLQYVTQALQQLMVTDDRNVVLNDIDDLPIDDPENNHYAQCKVDQYCRAKDINFLAPEQRLTEDDCNNHRLLNVTVKVDVWKIPNISEYILNENIRKDKWGSEVKEINLRLAPIHKKCKIVDPIERVTSSWVLQEYLKVYNELKKEGNWGKT